MRKYFFSLTYLAMVYTITCLGHSTPTEKKEPNSNVITTKTAKPQRSTPIANKRKCFTVLSSANIDKNSCKQYFAPTK